MSITQKPYYAIGLMIISTIAFACMDLIVKHLEAVSSYQLVFFRASGTLTLCLGYLIAKKIPLLGHNPKWLLIRGVAGTISMTLFFMAIKLIPLGTAVTLRYLSPMFAALLALLFLKEKFRPIQWVFFLMAFAGAALIKGFDFRVTLLGFILIMLSALFSGMVYAVIKKIGKTEHPLVIVGYFMFVATIAGLFLSLPTWVTPNSEDWIFLLSLGIFGFIGQLFMTLSLQSDLLVKVIPFKYTEAILVVVFGYFIFGEGFNSMAIIGMVLILAGMILNVTFFKKPA